MVLNALDSEEPDLSDLKLLPDTASLADKIKGCLQVGSWGVKGWGMKGYGERDFGG